MKSVCLYIKGFYLDKDRIMRFKKKYPFLLTSLQVFLKLSPTQTSVYNTH